MPNGHGGIWEIFLILTSRAEVLCALGRSFQYGTLCFVSHLLSDHIFCLKHILLLDHPSAGSVRPLGTSA